MCSSALLTCPGSRTARARSVQGVLAMTGSNKAAATSQIAYEELKRAAKLLVEARQVEDDGNRGKAERLRQEARRLLGL